MGVKTRTISTFNGATQAAGAGLSLLVDNQNRRVRVNKIEGYCFGANAADNAQYFLLIFAPPPGNVPLAGSVPLRSLQLTANLGFTFDYAADDPLDVSQLAEPPNAGCLLLQMSSTEGTYTAIGNGAKMDCSVDIEEYETQPINTSSQGDAVTARASLQVWAEATNPTPSALLKVIAQNNSGGTQYLMLFAKDNPQGGDVPIVPAWTFTNGQQRTLNFGDANAGIIPQSADTLAENPSATVRRGCSLFVSTTAGSFTAPGANQWNIQATYRVQP